ncbi:hypothetical protein, partial [Devosia elaeis]|uniref:hypothetical protein n=1 Tax=Devosia elaeis TaxID=1770058 RepID=UPI001969B532
LSRFGPISADAGHVDLEGENRNSELDPAVVLGDQLLDRFLFVRGEALGFFPPLFLPVYPITTRTTPIMMTHSNADAPR